MDDEESIYCLRSTELKESKKILRGLIGVFTGGVPRNKRLSVSSFGPA